MADGEENQGEVRLPRIGGDSLPADRSVYGRPGNEDPSYRLLEMFRSVSVV